MTDANQQGGPRRTHFSITPRPPIKPASAVDDIEAAPPIVFDQVFGRQSINIGDGSKIELISNGQYLDADTRKPLAGEDVVLAACHVKDDVSIRLVANDELDIFTIEIQDLQKNSNNRERTEAYAKAMIKNISPSARKKSKKKTEKDVDDEEAMMTDNEDELSAETEGKHLQAVPTLLLDSAEYDYDNRQHAICIIPEANTVEVSRADILKLMEAFKIASVSAVAVEKNLPLDSLSESAGPRIR